ncbi:MAG: hypothetical protein ACJZ8O_01220 [Pirellulaceae bacterium]
MAILVTCGACEKQFEVPDELAGQTGSCECGASVDIPGGAEPVAAESNPYSAPETAVEAAVAPATGAYDATELAGLKTCKSGFGLMYTAVLVALVGFVLFVIGLFSAGSSVGAGDASGAASGGLMMLAAMGAFGIGGLLHIIGSGMLMAAPGRSEAKGLFQLSFFSYIGALLLPFFRHGYHGASSRWRGVRHFVCASYDAWNVFGRHRAASDLVCRMGCWNQSIIDVYQRCGKRCPSEVRD